MGQPQKKTATDSRVIRELKAMTAIKPPRPANDTGPCPKAPLKTWHPTGGPFPTD